MCRLEQAPVRCQAFAASRPRQFPFPWKRRDLLQNEIHLPPQPLQSRPVDRERIDVCADGEIQQAKALVGGIERYGSGHDIETMGANGLVTAISNISRHLIGRRDHFRRLLAIRSLSLAVPQKQGASAG